MIGKHTYSPLSEPDHIRLLLLQPAVARDDDFVGSLQHISLNKHYYELINPYTALSYVWGDPIKTDTIILDDQPFGITANLGAALRGLRDETYTFRVWADALCIDQNNIPERSQQVRLMEDIYSRANSTIIYLGELTSHADAVIQAVPRGLSMGPHEESFIASDSLLDALTEVFTTRSHEEPSITSGTLFDDMTEEIITRPHEESSITSTRILDAIIEGVITRPWFHRVWVLQELVLSKDPWVQFSSKRIRWDELCRLLLSLLEQSSQIPEDRSITVKVLLDMHSIRSEYWRDRNADLDYDKDETTVTTTSTSDKFHRDIRQKKRSLCHILQTRKHCMTTDPRDMVSKSQGSRATTSRATLPTTTTTQLKPIFLAIIIAIAIFQRY